MNLETIRSRSLIARGMVEFRVKSYRRACTLRSCNYSSYAAGANLNLHRMMQMRANQLYRISQPSKFILQ